MRSLYVCHFWINFKWIFNIFLVVFCVNLQCLVGKKPTANHPYCDVYYFQTKKKKKLSVFSKWPIWIKLRINMFYTYNFIRYVFSAYYYYSSRCFFVYFALLCCCFLIYSDFFTVILSPFRLFRFVLCYWDFLWCVESRSI